MPGHYHIGTSGWSYPHWRERFYQHTPQKQWLSFYAQHFSAVEVNASFYRLPKTDTLQHWCKDTPTEFLFCLKANRYVTHTKRLKDPQQAVQTEKQVMSVLGKKLAVMLWQLPASLHFQAERLHTFLQALADWREVRHCIEFRHASWFNAETLALLQQHDIGNCQSDAADWPLWSAVSTDFAYLRLHGHSHTYVSSYNHNSLQQWAQQIQQLLAENKDVYVFFDNDAGGAAVRNAEQLLEILHKHAG